MIFIFLDNKKQEQKSEGYRFCLLYTSCRNDSSRVMERFWESRPERVKAPYMKPEMTWQDPNFICYSKMKGYQTWNPNPFQANDSVIDYEKLGDDKIQAILSNVEKACENMKRSPSVEEIQDMVENLSLIHI